MIGIDLDGTVLNYTHHTSQIRVNTAILNILRSVEPDDRDIAIAHALSQAKRQAVSNA